MNREYKAKNPYIITISSAISSTATQILCSPFGVVGVRQQKAYKVQMGGQQVKGMSYIDKNSFIRSAKNIYKNEGIFTFFNGMRYALFQTIVGSITMFLTYETAMEYFTKRLSVQKASFVSSIISSVINTTISFPFEYWKTLSQAHAGNCHLHNFSLGNKIYSAYFMTLQRNIILFTTWFPTIEFVRAQYKEHISDKQSGLHSLAINAISGFSAGIVSGIITQPLDICKNRKQIFSDFDNVKGTFNTIHKLYQQEGLKGFSPGFKTRLTGISMYGTILLSFYELGGKILHQNLLSNKEIEKIEFAQ